MNLIDQQILDTIDLDYTRQAELEQSMIERGAQRYADNNERALHAGDIARNQNKLFTSAFQKAVVAFAAAAAEASAKRGRPAAHVPALNSVDHELLTAITLRTLFNGAAIDRSVTDMAHSIGFEVEAEMACLKLAEQAKATNDKELKKLVGRKVTSARVGARKGEDLLEAAGEERTPDEFIKIGLNLINIALPAMDMFDMVEGDSFSGASTLKFTEAAQSEMDGMAEIQQWMHPVYQPMVTRPNPWTAMDTGAYNDARVAKTVPLMATPNKKIRKLVDEAAKAGAPFVRALNAVQDVPLQLNAKVLEVLEHCFSNGIAVGKVPGKPVEIAKDEDPKKAMQMRKDNGAIRAKRNAIRAAIAEAKQYVGNPFYQPHTLDWRGRVYARPGLNHQRADFAKGMYELARGEVLNEDGVYWLKWHVATTGAFKVEGLAMDKASHDRRVQWTDENLPTVRAVAEDPLASLELWRKADSPFCFLAACLALDAYLKDPTGYVCHIPVAVDGSCSGLQHFSALLRDPEGGSYVNLLPSDIPQDVYRTVASKVLPLVQADLADPEKAPMAQKWIDYGLDRKVAKRATMTFVYGSRQKGFADQLVEDIIDVEGKGRETFGTEWADQVPAAHYLAAHIMKAVTETVKAAAAAMEWLQKVAGILARHNIPVRWVTPLGLPVENAYHKPNVKQLTMTLWNRSVNVPVRYDPQVVMGYTKELLEHKQRNSIAPNFVHSLDSAHLMAVVLKAVDNGINDFLLIHDSFAALPNQMPKFNVLIRDAFVELYENNEPLEGVLSNAVDDIMALVEKCDSADVMSKLQKSMKDLGKLGIPAKGTLDLEAIRQSPYAFA
ncbi:DNA-dependent RNA polymerase [Caballeronia temeraria]|uniref:DNA-directed RNA polymerase n=1 Tax=Caballeronia temeraria TaxID=1777137 RepID=A0A158DMU9_9BURK|nr:DNA-directed RNA polymerase [Caballeronia temeraria]SAK95803.1 DNA-dependent RNA polymerase [Caballeronia temeraria]